MVLHVYAARDLWVDGGSCGWTTDIGIYYLWVYYCGWTTDIGIYYLWVDGGSCGWTTDTGIYYLIARLSD